MNYIYNAYHHFLTITKHKCEVMKNCFAVGLYRQGLLHDLSKYSWEEFATGVKYYQGNRSPNAAEKEEKGYSAAWLHHKGRNKHHFEYWIDFAPDKSSGASRQNLCLFQSIPTHTHPCNLFPYKPSTRQSGPLPSRSGSEGAFYCRQAPRTCPVQNRSSIRNDVCCVEGL